jgi:prepilin-type N-terminal cleavage/methylation domain-containing protein
MIQQIFNKKIKIKITGFTLTETMVAISIFTILAFGVSTLFSHIFISSRNRLTSISNIDSARTVATNFINEIRIASIGNDGGYPLNQASDSQIIFYSNYGQNPGVIAKIRYYLNENILNKGITIPTGSPLTYNSAQEKITMAQDNIINTGQPIFYYYDGNYNGSSSTPPLAQPINVNLVKYVAINMDILRQSSTISTSTFTVSAGASIRNLKTNLGN